MYTQSKLPYQIDNDASCPFVDSICQNMTGDFVLDTGYLDSWQYLGMNTEPRFGIRMRQHCAPLITEGYSLTQYRTDNDSSSYMLYDYRREGIPSQSADGTPLVYQAPLRNTVAEFEDKLPIARGADYAVG